MVVQRHGPADARELMWAPHPAELHEGVVALTIALQPVEPVVAPAATGLQLMRQAAATRLVLAPAVPLATIEVVGAVAVVLPGAAVVEDTLSRSRDLDVEAVGASDVSADVRDLHNHGASDQVWMGSAPVAVALGRELQLVALAAVLISGQAAAPAYGCCGEAHAQALAHGKGLVVRTAGRTPAAAR